MAQRLGEDRRNKNQSQQVSSQDNAFCLGEPDCTYSRVATWVAEEKCPDLRSVRYPLFSRNKEWTKKRGPREGGASENRQTHSTSPHHPWGLEPP